MPFSFQYHDFQVSAHDLSPSSTMTSKCLLMTFSQPSAPVLLLHRQAWLGFEFLVSIPSHAEQSLATLSAFCSAHKNIPPKSESKSWVLFLSCYSHQLCTSLPCIHDIWTTYFLKYKSFKNYLSIYLSIYLSLYQAFSCFFSVTLKCICMTT